MIHPYAKTEMVLEMYGNIPSTDHFGIITFFHAHRREIEYLDEDLFYTICSDYLRSLFRTGHYNSYYSEVDQMIEMLITDRVEFNREYYRELIFQKAQSAYECSYVLEGNRIMREYLRLVPACSRGRKLFMLHERKRIKQKYRLLYALCILLLFTLSGVLLTKIFIIDTFAVEQKEIINTTRDILLASVLTILLGFELISSLTAYFRFQKLNS